MTSFFQRLHQALEQPLLPAARGILAALVLLLVFAFTQPLWNIRMVAPQYPGGLELDIYAHTIEAGHGGQDLQEINTLNHYIGMRKIDRAELSDLDWIPFALGALALLTLRVAAIGEVRSLVDLMALTVYFGAFSAGRFAYKLYSYGHNLDPMAPIDVEPFTPAILGFKQIANFETWSYPRLGSAAIALFAAGVLALALLHVARGLRRPASA
jgi:hypothetical protein